MYKNLNKEQLKQYDNLMDYYTIFLVLVIVFLVICYRNELWGYFKYIYKFDLKKFMKTKPIVNLLPLSIVLTSLLAYVFLYIFPEKIFVYMVLHIDKDFYELSYDIIKSPTLYVEIATFGTLAGLYTLLLANRNNSLRELEKTNKIEVEAALEILKLKNAIILLQTELNNCPYRKKHNESINS